ncbi:MAG TPA: ABC transporter substrate-binding protein [Stellaceae bacterium]|nr:ABC transporter substrate-binding protein [Stellaceae bacterium]
MTAFTRRTALKTAAAASLFAMPGIHPAAAQSRLDTGPVRIGVLTDMSSWGRDNGGPGSVYAAKAAVREVGGEVAGRKIEVLVGDHQMVPDIGLGIARRWFDQEGVHAITDLENSAIALGVGELAKQNDRIALMTGPGSSEITNSRCNDRTAQFTYDSYALGKVMARAVTAQGAKTWFFITADYAYGKQLQADTTTFVQQAGGKVLGSVAHPSGTMDFSSLLLQAQGSGAEVIAFANTGTDCTNCLKQAAEFGLSRGGTRIAGLSMFLTDIHAAGLQVAQGAYMTVSDYWDMTPETVAWSQGYLKEIGMMPTMLQTGAYGAVRHYLKAVKAAGTTNSSAIMEKMRELPVTDMFTKGAVLRKDGRVVRDMYLARVKAPSESKKPWDYLEIVQTVRGDDAYRPLSDSVCPLVKA